MGNAIDVNPLGRPDLIISAHANNGRKEDHKGAVYVLFGQGGGYVNRPLSTTTLPCTGLSDYHEIQNPEHTSNGLFGSGL